MKKESSSPPSTVATALRRRKRGTLRTCNPARFLAYYPSGRSFRCLATGILPETERPSFAFWPDGPEKRKRFGSLRVAAACRWLVQCTSQPEAKARASDGRETGNDPILSRRFFAKRAQARAQGLDRAKKKGRKIDVGPVFQPGIADVSAGNSASTSAESLAASKARIKKVG